MVKVLLPLNANTKRKQQTLLPSASTNGGDASRVFFQQPRPVWKMQCTYTKQRLTDGANYTLVCEPLPKILRDAPPLSEVAFGV